MYCLICGGLLKNFIVLLLLLFVMSSCSSYKKNQEETVDLLYAKGLSALAKNDIIEAQKTFQQITDDYPYREEATEAQIFLIWTYYVQEDLMSAEINIDAFLKYYVYNDYIPWVNYMSALVQYENIQIPDRDQNATSNALIGFFNIVKKDPNSKYAKDAKLRMEVAKYNIAQRHMNVAKYYLYNTNYFASIKRYQEVVEHFSDTQYSQEALYRLTYLWLLLGVDEEAFRVSTVLGYNYPESVWYRKSYDLIRKHTKYNNDSNIKKVPTNK